MKDIQAAGTPVDIISQQDINEVKAKFVAVEKFRATVRGLLRPNADYGNIAGNTVLFKSGAEKIIWILGLRTEFEIINAVEDFENGFFAYTVKCRLKRGDEVITEGLGHANTKERNRIKKDPYTEANAVLKMAEKRALVDAAIHAGVLSDIFTQDIEDITPTQHRPSTGKVIADKRTISEKQMKRLYAIAGGNTEIIKQVLEAHGYEHTKDITRDDYEAIVEEVAEMAGKQEG